MDQPPHDNQTDFAVHPQLILDKDGERLLAIVKASFELPQGATELELAPPERTRGIRFADVPWEDDEKSSIAYPGDVCVRKPGTDVIVTAIAYAPGGQPVPSFDVYVRVGPLRKALKVYGLRVWQAGGAGLSSPRNVSEVEMRYENAWGGSDDSDPENFVEESRNPSGKGVVRDLNSLTDQIAPCIEDPENPLRSARTRPPPAGIGAISRHWEPRRRYIGTYNAAWKEFRAPLPPDDEDDRLHLCASPGLTAVPPLRGGEECGFLNLIPGGGALSFCLPKVQLELEFRVKDRDTVIARPYLDTVLIDLLAVGPEKPPAVELVWRASVKAPRKLKDSFIIIREAEPT